MKPDALFPTLAFGRARLAQCTEPELMAALEVAIRQRLGVTVVTPNLNHLVLLERDASFRAAYEHSGVQATDSTLLRWFTFLSRTPVPSRLAGSDLFPGILELARRASARVVVVGGSPHTAIAARRRVAVTFPDLAFEILTPPQHFEGSDEHLTELRTALMRLRPDVLVLCIGTPRSEVLGLKLASEFPQAIICSFGAAIDFFAGTKRRAPALLQQIGLEWAFRILMEPRRLARRYAETAWRMPPILGACLLAGLRSRGRSFATSDRSNRDDDEILPERPRQHGRPEVRENR